MLHLSEEDVVVQKSEETKETSSTTSTESSSSTSSSTTTTFTITSMSDSERELSLLLVQHFLGIISEEHFHEQLVMMGWTEERVKVEFSGKFMYLV